MASSSDYPSTARQRYQLATEGLDLLCKIKAEPPPVPVCMMTAYDTDGYRRRAEECQCDGYLTKPIDFRALKERIWAYVDVQAHQP